MPCCKIESSEQNSAYGSNDCCRESGVSECSCNFEFPVQPITQSEKTPEIRPSFTQSVYSFVPAVCVFCIDPPAAYLSDLNSDSYYKVSVSKFLSGRSPPSV